MDHSKDPSLSPDETHVDGPDSPTMTTTDRPWGTLIDMRPSDADDFQASWTRMANLTATPYVAYFYDSATGELVDTWYYHSGLSLLTQILTAYQWTSTAHFHKLGKIFDQWLQDGVANPQLCLDRAQSLLPPGASRIVAQPLFWNEDAAQIVLVNTTLMPQTTDRMATQAFGQRDPIDAPQLPLTWPNDSVPRIESLTDEQFRERIRYAGREQPWLLQLHDPLTDKVVWTSPFATSWDLVTWFLAYADQVGDHYYGMTARAFYSWIEGGLPNPSLFLMEVPSLHYFWTAIPDLTNEVHADIHADIALSPAPMSPAQGAQRTEITHAARDAAAPYQTKQAQLRANSTTPVQQNNLEQARERLAARRADLAARRIFPCPFCDSQKMFTERRNVRDHIKRMHPNKKSGGNGGCNPQPPPGGNGDQPPSAGGVAH